MAVMDWKCVECGGSGTLQCGMGPTPYYAICDDCSGTGYVDSERYLSQCMTEIRVARKAQWMCRNNPRMTAEHRGHAKHWIGNAKKARADLLESEHAGSAHIGRAA